jgi:hypothetical protein
MSESLRVVADTVTQVAGQVEGDPYSVKVVGWLVLTFTAILVLKFIAECIIKKKFVFGIATPLHTYKYKLTLEILWVLIISITGIVTRLIIANGTNAEAARTLFVSIGLLSAGLAGFFTSEYLIGAYTGTLNKPLYYINAIITEWTWLCWLVYSSGSFIANFIDFNDGYGRLTWSGCFTWGFLRPIAVFGLKFSLIFIKYRNSKAHNR